ncbi:beta-1,4-glucuronyltransferase 1-like [Limulus polyphemus]|uniref:Beta-1,4-glucuronyltransferase 1 n=1 Tax=Limulus polyphemus TaxID=6850 RepID=A0ABM1C545_LIMPO|nr:beta-1,4-glucuronyltransferase 1-like [Limulus polyphemus]
MPALWKQAVVLLAFVIAVLQVIHMTLLSQLEGRKHKYEKSTSGNSADRENQDYQESTIRKDRAQMLKTVQQNSVLDSSGEFQIINFLMRAESLGSRNIVSQDLSIVTHTTVNHLHYLSTLSERWQGPMSVSVFAVTQGGSLAVESILYLRHCFPSIRYNTSFHLIYPLKNLSGETKIHQEKAPVFGSCDNELNIVQHLNVPDNDVQEILYPNNLLRNVARKNALTEYVFTIDIDLLPSSHLHTNFLTFAKENRLFLDSHKDDKTVYVVHAFEVKKGTEVPAQKTSLIQLLELMEARPFSLELCWKCQKHTDYDAWEHEPQAPKLNVLFEVLWRDPWQPFYIARNTVPLYDERFRQYKFNGISQVCELHVAGYRFSVLNNAFLVHDGWKTTPSFHKSKDVEQERNRVLFRNFKAELQKKYPESSRRCY